MSINKIHPERMKDLPDLSGVLLKNRNGSKAFGLSNTTLESNLISQTATLNRKSRPALLECGHLIYTDRQKRLDLISNKMLDIQMQVNGTQCHLCDISESGFAYAKRVKTNTNVDYFSIKKLIEVSARGFIGKQVQAGFSSDKTTEENPLKISCTIHNHQLMYGLSLEELEREFNKLLYFKSIRRGKDKDHFFDKINLLSNLTRKLIFKRGWDDALAVSLNTTFINMMKEVGASKDTFDNMYNGYRDKPVFIRFGVSIDKKADQGLFSNFARKAATPDEIMDVAEVVKNENSLDEISKVAALLMDKLIPAERGQRPVEQQTIRVVNGKTSYHKFLIKAWENCLSQFNLNFKTDIPKSQNQKLASRMKMDARLFNTSPKQFAEDDTGKNNKKSTEHFLTVGLCKILKKKGKTDIQKVQLIVHKTVQETLNSYLSELGK